MTRILTCGPARHADPVWALTGVQVCHCRTPATENAALAGMKHLNRLDCVLARREWTDPQVAEGLMHDSRGSIVGGTMTNLFAVRRGSLLTPAIRACGVRGVMRGVVIDAARGVGISVEEGNVSVDDLAVADELFLSNAVVGLWPIRALAERRYIVGRTTLRLRELCAQVAATEV